MTYECQICLNVNNAVKLHCSTCGTIPAIYSITSTPAKDVSAVIETYAAWNTGFIPVVVARGADRAEHHRTVRTYLRTVKSDYYATA